jgi:branched-chain amino acid transport system substrate-binding protein
LRKLKYVVVACLATAIAAATLASGSAGAQTSTTASGGKKTLYIIGGFTTKGEEPIAQPQFDDGMKMGVAELQKKGWDVKYERIPVMGTNAASAEQGFLTAQSKNPDFYASLTSSNVFIPVGPKVAATDLPTFAFSSPTEGVRNGPSGGDNIFLLRALNEQTYQKAADVACGMLKLHKIGLSLVQTAFGPTAQQAFDREAKKYKDCKSVTAQYNSATATDTTQQVLAFKSAGVDGIVSANFPGPMGVQVNQLRQNGVDVPFIGGASLNLAKENNGITTGLQNLYVLDDCVPDLSKTKPAKAFVKEYQATYGYTPNYASGQAHDAVLMAANAIEKAGSHDHAALNKAMLSTDFSGACTYKIDKNNVLDNAVWAYKYNTDGTKKLIKVFPLQYTPPTELATTAPPTTAPRAG